MTRLLKKILAVANKYSLNAPTIRIPERIQTLGRNIELENKLNISSADDVKWVLEKISKIGFSKVEHRTENHYFFSSTGFEHAVLIGVQGSSEIWIKAKREREILRTPNTGFPILLRKELKIRPQEKEWWPEFERTLTKKYVGSFKKECIDFSFYFENLSFTVTLSLAQSSNDSLYQIEFEFDGHKKKTTPPKFDEIIKKFERMLCTILPESRLNGLNTYTKLEWLLSNRMLLKQ